MRKILLLLVSLILVFSCTLAVPVFAAELDHQYAFVHEFDFSDFYSFPDVPWHVVDFGDTLDYSSASGDYVTFSIDQYKFDASFQLFSSSGVDVHYIGNLSALFPGQTDTGEAYCLVIWPNHAEYNQLLLRDDFFEPLYQGNKTKVHVAVSVAHFDFKQDSFLEKLFSLFSDIGQWLRAQLDLIIGLFWNAQAVQLTFFGVLALVSLGLSLVLLLIKVILNFLHFRS